MVVVYLTLAELLKQWFYAQREHRRPLAVTVQGAHRRIQRRAFRWSHRQELP